MDQVVRITSEVFTGRKHIRYYSNGAIEVVKANSPKPESRPSFVKEPEEAQDLREFYQGLGIEV